jgi:hypothetical protein
VILSSAQIDDVRAFIEAAAAGLVCVGPTASCPHTVMVVTPAEVPTLRNLYVDVVTGTAPSVTIGMNGAKVASTNDAVGAVMLVIALAQSTACSTTGKTPGALGPVDCVSATVMDPDGDGYTTDNELLSNTNPLHKNSSPRNRGAGFLLDWDGDGYTNDYELLANGDPLHECSTPANRRGIVVSC